LRVAPEGLVILAGIPAFPLVTAQLNKYQLTYPGKQPVDDLTTYLFRVKPKQPERKIAYFEGLVWVDDRDLVVAKTYGKWVTEVGDVSTPQLLFTLFETQRENIDGKLWFPNYARSADTLNLTRGDVRIRLTIRWT